MQTAQVLAQKMKRDRILDFISTLTITVIIITFLLGPVVMLCWNHLFAPHYQVTWFDGIIMVILARTLLSVGIKIK
jgi:hypothetical protein